MSQTQRLAVDRDRTSTLAGAVAVGKPRPDRRGECVGVQAGEGPADGGLGRRCPVTGERIAAGPKRGTHGLGRVDGPLGDGGDRPRTRHDRSSGQPQNGDQRVGGAQCGPWGR